jgi:Tfp pilus assembly protein PilF
MNNPLHGKETSLEVSRFYAQAWLLCHYLILGGHPGRNQQMQDYARCMAQGMSSKAAFAKAFPISTEALGQELSAYLQHILFLRMIPEQRLIFKSLNVDPAFSSHEMAKDQVQARLGMLAILLLKNGDLAKRHFQAALAIDPACVQAHLGQGWLLMFAGDQEAAYEHFSQAADRQVDDASLQLMVGEYLYSQACAKENLDLAKLARAREYLFQHMKQVRGRSSSMELLRKSFAADPEHGPEWIVKIDAAIKAEPERWNYAALLADIHLDRHEPDEALPLLLKVANQTKDEMMAQWARDKASHLGDQGARDGLTDGMRLAREEKFAEALVVLQQAKVQAKDPDLQRRIQSILKMVQLPAEHAQAIEPAAGAGNKIKTKARRSP